MNFPEKYDAVKSRVNDIKNGIVKNRENGNADIPALDEAEIDAMIEKMDDMIREQKLCKAKLRELTQQKEALKQEANALIRSAYDIIRGYFKRGNRRLELFGFKVHSKVRYTQNTKNSGGESETNE
jgi:acylphosphatase